MAEFERLGRLRRFLAPQIADLLVSAEGEALLESHRRQIAVVCCQLPGFATLADATAPEEVLAVLHAYHQRLGRVIFEFEGTVGPLVEDRLTVLFNDPLPTDDPAGQAVRLALAMRDRMAELLHGWRKVGHLLDFGVGIDLGYATVGTIGFEGKTEYAAIGTVARLAAQLCDRATGQQILVSHRVHVATEALVESSNLGEQSIAGFLKPVPVFAVERLRSTESTAALPEPERASIGGPLTDREREVVSLIIRGCTNRQIAEELVIAEGTAVRPLANILNKLTLHSRAQVAVWACSRPSQSGTDDPVNRRHFIRRAGLAGLTAAAGMACSPLAIPEPARSVPVAIGLLYGGGVADDVFDAFAQGLQDYGWIEGKNITIIRADVGADTERLPAEAIALAGKGVA